MTERQAGHDILPLFLNRWSPRAFDPRPIDDDVLMTLFEAARWAPSSFNYQPWRFVFAKRNDAHWDGFMAALLPFNQIWVQNVSALVYILSEEMMEVYGERKPSHSHSFDAGAAWMALALQSASMGLITHGMTGVDFDAAAKVVNLPDGYRIDAAFAIGYHGDKSILPEKLQEREVKSDRKPLSDIVFNGPLPA